MAPLEFIKSLVEQGVTFSLHRDACGNDTGDLTVIYQNEHGLEEQSVFGSHYRVAWEQLGRPMEDIL